MPRGPICRQGPCWAPHLCGDPVQTRLIFCSDVFLPSPPLVRLRWANLLASGSRWCGWSQEPPRRVLGRVGLGLGDTWVPAQRGGPGSLAG